MTVPSFRRDLLVSRYSLILDADSNRDAALLNVSLADIPPTYRQSRYNINRGQPIIVIRDNINANPEQPAAATLMQWGFTPHWIHCTNPALQPLTVAAEKISQPYFREAFQQRRCLIPASGFYAWQGWENGPAAPYYVRMRDRQPFFMAAIWDSCEGVDRAAMITTAANTLLQPIYHRMPAIIPREHIDTWLRGGHPQQWLTPHADAVFEMYRVGRKIFGAANEGPDLIAPAATADFDRYTANTYARQPSPGELRV
jgi:putative SOS response-associated peptidase YedK